jgi:hypothetical protein
VAYNKLLQSAGLLQASRLSTTGIVLLRIKI